MKATILYLARSKRGDIENLKHSLSLLDINFNDKFNYPVIIFHEDFNESLLEDIQKSTRSNLKFEKVDFQVPDFLKNEAIPEFIYVDGFEFSIGYRHMCRFFSGLIYQNPALKGYDYYWRLDTDSFLLGKIDYDIFRFMQENDYLYGYMCTGIDHPDVVNGIWDITKKYIEANDIKPTFLQKFTPGGIWDMTGFGTNFEISNLDFWHSSEFKKYFDYLDHEGGIYKHRWGDNDIHFLAVSMFIPEDRIHKFEDIAYQHQSFINNYNIMGSSSRLKNIELKFITIVLKMSTSLKRKSKLYRTFMQLLRQIVD
jgi:alpha 1,2-mannosyltransferase